MKKEKYDILLKVIDRWNIDIENGIVRTKFGKVTNKILGYERITTSYEGKNYSFKIHQVIVVKAGLNPVGLTVNHINGDKTDNRIDNLEIVTSKENTHHAIKTGLRLPPNPISDETYKAVKSEAISGKLSQRDIAKKYGVGVGTVSEIKNGKRKRDL